MSQASANMKNATATDPPVAKMRNLNRGKVGMACLICSEVTFFGTLLAQVAGDRWVLLGLLICSIASAAAFVVHHVEGPATYVIGASGAISGVAGFYVLLSFRWEIPWAMAWPLARPVPPFHAALIAIVAVGMDLYVLRSGGSGGIAVDAHLGGFAGGLLLGAVLTTFFPTWERFRMSAAGRGVHGP